MRWTAQKIKGWILNEWGKKVSCSTIRTYLKQAGLSWKKSKKALGKAVSSERETYLTEFEGYFEALCRGEVRLIYIDEAHFHQDVALGYRWSLKGVQDWAVSNCPPLENRLNWYGAYDFGQGQCFIKHYDRCNSDNTVAFLETLSQQWATEPSQETVIIWDGASWHGRATVVKAAAIELGLTLVQLPKYSPDLNPIEGLWKWMRECVTQHKTYDHLFQLEKACLAFIETINRTPDMIVNRLWAKFELDPTYEKVLFSF